MVKGGYSRTIEVEDEDEDKAKELEV